MKKRIVAALAALVLAVGLASITRAAPATVPYDVNVRNLSVNGNEFDGGTSDTLSSNASDSVTVTDAINIMGIRGYVLIANTVADSADTILAPTIQARAWTGGAWNGSAPTTVLPGTQNASVVTAIPTSGTMIATLLTEGTIAGGSPYPIFTQQIRFRLKGNMAAMNGGGGATNRKRPTHGLTLRFFYWY